MRRALFITAGTLTLILGSIGVILPLLPTTPMLLLTVYFYSKGSERFHRWFLSTRLYDRYLRNYHEQQGMTKKGKIKLMFIVDTMLLVSFITMNVLVLRALIIMLILVKYWYFIKRVKTLPEPQKNSDDERGEAYATFQPKGHHPRQEQKRRPLKDGRGPRGCDHQGTPA